MSSLPLLSLLSLLLTLIPPPRPPSLPPLSMPMYPRCYTVYHHRRGGRWGYAGIVSLYVGIYTVTVQIRGPLVYTGIIVYFASTFAGHYVKMSDATPPERREDALGTL